MKINNTFAGKPLIYFFIVICLFLSDESFGQDKIELIHADELSGKTVDGQIVREANGNVEFTQGNVRVLCNSATQYIDANTVELRGNVRIYQDTLTLTTSKATYFGGERKAMCQGAVTLKDPNATIRADNGTYFFNEAKAVFTGDVIIVNPEYKITSNELTYNRASEDSFAKGNVIVTTDSAVIKAEHIDFYKSHQTTFARENVRIESDSTVITADSATNFSAEKRSFASGHVKIESINNNTKISGSKVENFEKFNYSIVTGNARLIQVEDNKDTLHIYSDTMEAFRIDDEFYIARGNTEVIRNEFLSKCGQGVYFKTKETISLFEKPVVWQENLQLTGDSIYAELPGNKLQKIFVRKLPIDNSEASFAISSNSDAYFSDRYDQISGTDITISINNEKVDHIEVNKNSRSIYFVYDSSKANGVNKVEGEDLFIFFGPDEKVSRIRVDTNPKGEYIPEKLLNTTSLTLPGFNLRDDKPVVRN